MLLASEAAEKAQKMIYQHRTEELQKIEQEIMARVERGKFEYAFDGYISNEAKNELERCGYKVVVGSQYNQGWVIIKWG